MPSLKQSPQKKAETPRRSARRSLASINDESEESRTTPRKRKSRKNSDSDGNDTPSKTPKKLKLNATNSESDICRTPEKTKAATPRKVRTPLVKLDRCDVAKDKKKPALALEHCNDDLVEEIIDVEKFSSIRRRASIKPSLDDVAEVSTEDDDDDTREALSMYGKYGKIIGERGMKTNTNDGEGPLYGFATPKKNSMIDRTNLVLSATKKTPVSKAMERGTPRKRSAPSTPTSAMKNTPLSKLKLRGDAPETPRSVRRRITTKLERKAEASSSSSEDESDDNSDNSDEDEGVKPIDSDDKLVGSDTDEFFEKQNNKQIVTSDKTLNQLKTPRLSPEVLRNILEEEPLKHASKIELLCQRYKRKFPKWMHLLDEGYSVVLYGLGSKRNLLNDFHVEMLDEQDCVVVNGFFPSLTMKHILGTILSDILEFKGNIGTSLVEQSESVLRAYSSEEVKDDLYLLVHNIEGPMLRNELSQTILARLAGHPRIHLICSIDHINAPLLWDQQKLSNFNFIWQDTTTFLPYTEETLNENSLMVRSGGSGLALHSLARVFESLTPNAREIYMLIVSNQMKAVEEEGLSMFQGLSFKDLYRQCRRAFLVNSDLTLRAQLTEFVDHKLIRNKRGSDGMDYLIIPLENSTLQEFIEQQKSS